MITATTKKLKDGTYEGHVVVTEGLKPLYCVNTGHNRITPFEAFQDALEVKRGLAKKASLK